MHDISAILADTKKYGFVLVSDSIRTDRGETDLGTGPILTVVDVAVFDREFPGRIAASLDGSSFRVISQRVDRDLLQKTRIPEPERMAVLGPKVLNAILGIRSRTATVVVVTEKVYAMPDGSTTKDEAEFRMAWGIDSAPQESTRKGPGDSDATKVLGTKLNP